MQVALLFLKLIRNVAKYGVEYRTMKSLLAFSLVLASHLLHSQCKLNDLFPWNIGATKFQVVKQLNLNSVINEVFEFPGRWEDMGYLSNDSIYKVQVSTGYTFHPCLGGRENYISLVFCDDKLYTMSLRVMFEPRELDECLSLYETICSCFMVDFPYKQDVVSLDSKREEQIGEGAEFYKSEQWLGAKKPWKATVDYSARYESIWDSFQKTFVSSGKIEKYVLNIDFTDCRQTKLDSRGY